MSNLKAWEININDFPKNNLSDQIKFLLKFAVLAPSSHNTQPWLFFIDRNGVDFHIDEARWLPASDPSKREMYISIGSAVENFIQAAEAYGFDLKAEYFPEENKKELVARVGLLSRNSRVNETQLNNILNRINYRDILEEKKVDSYILDECTNLNNDNIGLLLIDEKDKIDKVAELTGRGMEKVISDKDFREELSGWIINNYSKREVGMPGYSMTMPGIISIIVPKALKYINMGKPMGAQMKKTINNAAVIGIISGQDDKMGWLESGRAYEKIALYLVSKGMQSAVFAATVEVEELNNELKQYFNVSGRPLIVFRFGYPKKQIRKSPRIKAEKLTRFK